MVVVVVGDGNHFIFLREFERFGPANQKARRKNGSTPLAASSTKKLSINRPLGNLIHKT